MTKGNSHPVPSNNAAVGIEAEYAPSTTGCHDHRTGIEQVQLTCADLQGNDPTHAALVGDQIKHEVLVKALNLRILQGGLIKRMEHVKPGLVGGEPGAFCLHSAKATHLHAAICLP